MIDNFIYSPHPALGVGVAFLSLISKCIAACSKVVVIRTAAVERIHISQSALRVAPRFDEGHDSLFCFHQFNVESEPMRSCVLLTATLL